MECDECEGVKTLELHTPITASLQITKAEDYHFRLFMQNI